MESTSISICIGCIVERAEMLACLQVVLPCRAKHGFFLLRTLGGFLPVRSKKLPVYHSGNNHFVAVLILERSRVFGAVAAIRIMNARTVPNRYISGCNQALRIDNRHGVGRETGGRLHPLRAARRRSSGSLQRPTTKRRIRIGPRRRSGRSNRGGCGGSRRRRGARRPAAKSRVRVGNRLGACAHSLTVPCGYCFLNCATLLRGICPGGAPGACTVTISAL